MYGFVVDGVHILDPLNPLVDPTFFFLSNQVRVPGSEPPTPSQSSALRKASRRVSQTYDTTFSLAGLTSNQFSLLWKIERRSSHPSTMRDLARA
jgi:hypothetical protein